MNNACVHLLKSYSLPLSQVGQVFGRKPCAGDALFAFLRPTSIDKQARRFLSGAASSLGCAPYEVNTLKRRRIDSVETFRPYTDVQPFHTTAIRLIRKPIHRPAAPSSPRASANGRNVPIPFGNIGKKELDKIFEHDILYEEGNKMLQILHSRRVTGALVDQGVHIKGTHTVPLEALTKALDWLRAKYPVDEQSAADAWAQQEAKRLEETYIARAEKLGLYKPLDAEEQTTELSTNSVYGNNSVLDEFKRFHEERRKREAKEKKESGEEQRSQELQMAKRVEAEQAQETRMKIIEERRELRAKKGMVTEEMPVPDVTLFQRLFPSTAFGLLIIAGVLVIGATYTPPVRSERFFSNTPIAVATIAAVMAPSVLIYILWKVPTLWKTLNTYFRQSPGSPYAFSVFGNMFSHPTLGHLGANLTGLWFYGTSLHEDIGRSNWITLYFTGGVFGSLFSLWSHVLMKRFDVTTYGASGAVWAIMAAWAYVTIGKPAPSTENWEFAILASQWACLALQVLGHCTPGIMSRIDVASHVGGALVGLVGAYFITRKAVTSKVVDDSQDAQRVATEARKQ